jgi:hypothetical protein
MHWGGNSTLRRRPSASKLRPTAPLSEPLSAFGRSGRDPILDKRVADIDQG